VSSAASAAGIAAVNDAAHLAAAVAHNDKWLPWLTREISALGLDVLPSVANFVAIRFPPAPGRAAADADRFLASRGLVLRAIGAYGMGEFLRLTVGSQEANEAVVAALAEFVSDRKAAVNG
jgi:histidinol-phosphate aminotransferase